MTGRVSIGEWLGPGTSIHSRRAQLRTPWCQHPFDPIRLASNDEDSSIDEVSEVEDLEVLLTVQLGPSAHFKAAYNATRRVLFRVIGYFVFIAHCSICISNTSPQPAVPLPKATQKLSKRLQLRSKRDDDWIL